MADEFKPVGDFESLPKAVAKRIMQSGWPVVSGKIDLAFGCAPIVGEKSSKAVWTMDGRRITVTIGGGALIVAQSREVDPLHSARGEASRG